MFRLISKRIKLSGFYLRPRKVNRYIVWLKWGFPFKSWGVK